MKARQYLKKHGIKIAVIVVVVAIITLIGLGARAGRANAAENALGELASPVQTAASAVVGWFEGLYGYLYEYDILVEENNALRAQVAELQEQAREYSAALEENDALRELLGFLQKNTNLEDLELAKIIAWDASNYTSAFTISKGERSGIEVGDCVITEYGALVGQVIELGDTWATVRTIIDVHTDVGALVGDSQYAGVISGEYSAMRDGQTQITYLASGASIFEGDEILTSGKGGLFPSGLLIGRVAAVMSEAGGQVVYGIVEPACNLGTLSQIYVVKSFEIAE